MIKIKAAALFILFSFISFSQQVFEINLNDIDDDLFKVTILPEGLSGENNIYNFAATAPGTYAIMDIGRYVRSFTAVDFEGNELPVNRISTNRWELSNPEKIKQINYTIAETWDTPVEKEFLLKMAGTSIEKDHVLINAHAVLGYFEGMQDYPMYIRLDYPDDWLVGTPLSKNENGFYEAKNYDFAVDSPIMLGRLSKAETKVEETDIYIYTYSKTDMVKSEDILNSVSDILTAASRFTNGLPVDKYVFLFHFEDQTVGAWEHSYSSAYVMKESPLNEQAISSIRSMVSHEFFHIVTPLNIHSEIVADFNYSSPQLSQHLWLYEGTTEWAAMMLQLRGGITTLEETLDEFKKKLMINDYFDQSISLRQLSLNSFELHDQYINIYHKGAVIAALMDLKLLQLSKGKKGLREVINELVKIYGPDKPFNEENFFNEFVDMTYPEMEDYFNKYIIGAEPLPVQEYFSSIGINYYPFKGYDSSKVSMGISLTFDGTSLIISKVDNPGSGFKEGDILYKVDGEELNMMTAQKIMGKMQNAKVGDELTLTVKREGEEKEIKAALQPSKIMHVFEIDENATQEQIELRNLWMINMDV